MSPIDDRTSFRSYQKPNAANTLADDVTRLRAALDAIDADIPANIKRSVLVATTANIALSGVQTIDGVSVVAGNRVLVKNQSTASLNGIYDVSTVSWIRSTDADTSTEIDGAIVNIEQGTQGGRSWATTFKSTDTLGTTAMNWYAIVDTSFASSSTPNAVGTAAIGTSTNYARADHVHGGVASFSGGTTGLTPSSATTGVVTLAGTLAVANGGTGVTTSTGSGSVVLGTSPTLTTPLLGTPTSGTLTNCTGYTFANISSKPTTLSGYGITDAATSTHTHGNITNGGAIGTTSGLPIITTTSGLLTTGSFGTTSGTFCQGNDTRLSDTRNTTNSITFNNAGSGGVSGSTFNGSSVLTVSYNTVGAPSTSGTNASGTWAISISGTAATATNQSGGTVNATTGTFSGDITMSGTGQIEIPAGTTAQRTASPVSGMIRYNTTLGQYEGYGASSWGQLGGGATGASGDTVFIENGQTVTASYTLTSGKNAVSAGPITINSGAIVTIPSGASWVIV